MQAWRARRGVEAGAKLAGRGKQCRALPSMAPLLKRTDNSHAHGAANVAAQLRQALDAQRLSRQRRHGSLRRWRRRTQCLLPRGIHDLHSDGIQLLLYRCQHLWGWLLRLLRLLALPLAVAAAAAAAALLLRRRLLKLLLQLCR